VAGDDGLRPAVGRCEINLVDKCDEKIILLGYLSLDGFFAKARVSELCRKEARHPKIG
jgi:hypothetical protein